MLPASMGTTPEALLAKLAPGTETPVGAVRGLAAVLDECSRMPAVERPEREAIRRCLDWFGALAVNRDV